MNFPNCKVAASLILALMCWPHLLHAQTHRDFIRQDDEGHLILRFAGALSDALDAEQEEEIVNAFVSVMVHDRLRADVNFEAEDLDIAWAKPTERRLDEILSTADSDLQLALVECRSVSCRIVFEHADVWRVAEHQSLMASVQRIVEVFISEASERFENTFLIAAYYQEREPQHIKVYLRRATAP